MSSSVSSSTATSLIFRLQKNDADAWRQFVELYAPLIFHWCHQLRLEAQDGADIMQEVFAVAAQAIGRYQKRTNGTFRGWLWTITQNKIRDHFRKNARRPQAMGGNQAKWNLEQLADRVTSEQDSMIRDAKDLAAAAVLTAAIISAAVGCIIFLPRFLSLVASGSDNP